MACDLCLLRETSELTKKPALTMAQRVRTWLIVALIMVNVGLTAAFVWVLLGGTITDRISIYIRDRHLYAPPMIALIVTLSAPAWEAAKWVFKSFLPNAERKQKFGHAVLHGIRRLAKPRLL